jgi:hypothetical protein
VSTRSEANLRAWAEVLDRLERDVEVTEQLVRAASTPIVAPEPVAWQPPVLDGPLPDELLGRAREIHQRQTRAKAALSAALAESRAKQQAGRSVRPAAAAPAAAAYVDVSA